MTQISTWKYSLSAVALVLILNPLLRALFPLHGSAVHFVVAAGVAALIAAWFARAQGRRPSPEERSQLVYQYGGAIGVLFAAIVVTSARSQSPSAAGLLLLFLHYLPYPAFLQLFLSERGIEPFLRK